VSASTLSIGFVPPSFPRDPVDVNQFDEHIILGQIMEPLVDADGDGKLVPSVAKDWRVEDFGKTLIFMIDSSIEFNNGEKVKAKDVVYSIKRHLSSNSQSKNFLSDVEIVEAIGDAEVRIRLKSGNVFILKALTRDQLGIVPEGWTFDVKSDKPYVATGPYALVRKEGQFFLEKNKHFKRYKVSVDTWRLSFFKDASFSMPDVLPDLVPVVTVGVFDKMKKNLSFSNGNFKVEKRLGFSQTSFWVHSESRLFADGSQRLLAQRFMNDLISDYVNERTLERSRGLIPVGIQGSLESVPKILSYTRKNGIKEIKIAAISGIFNDFLSDENIAIAHSKYGVKILKFMFSPAQFSEMHNWKPDIVAGSWAGGFNDPAGFLGLLNSLLGKNFESYLGEDGAKMKQADLEQDWQARTSLYRSLGATVIQKGFLTPGWRVETYEVMRANLKVNAFQTRYTPRLVNFSEMK